MTKRNNELESNLELLLMDILLKSENPVKRYPLGQLKERLSDFISKTLQQQREEIIEGFEKLTDNFPKLIKDTRKTLMENQTKFGARFGLAHNTISYIEQGKFESPWSIISFCQKYQLKSLKEKK